MCSKRVNSIYSLVLELYIETFPKYCRYKYLCQVPASNTHDISLYRFLYSFLNGNTQLKRKKYEIVLLWKVWRRFFYRSYRNKIISKLCNGTVKVIH